MALSTVTEAADPQLPAPSGEDTLAQPNAEQSAAPPVGPFGELDRNFQIWLSSLTAGVSPASLGLAYADWLAHLSIAPGKLLGLWIDGLQKALNFQFYEWRADRDAPPCIAPLPQDRRFVGDDWQKFPFNVWQQSFLSLQAWWQNAVRDVKGLNPHHADVVAFLNRQLLDAVSPSNYVLSNPEVLRKTLETGGQNLVSGLWHFCDDWCHGAAGKLPRHLQPFTVGEQLATTPGKVVFRNRLIELIQYAPATDTVYAEPVLIVPAWIMKYYILDLTAGKSLVEYLVAQGHTVFIISWKNPTAEDRDVGLNDYLKLGLMASLTAINAIVPGHKVHAAGYCLGGTLLAIGAAWLGRLGDTRLQTVTLLAAQTDFDQAGELLLFLDDSQLAFLDNIMQQQGYLTKHQMKTIFQMLRSNDLIWSYLINHYLLGKRTEVNELMAWSADATRMPYTMHKEYLEKLFLRDQLAEGHYKVDGKAVALRNIEIPIFCVATEKDHVSPWRSVYKINLLTDTEVSFVLTNGGHNAGIVSELDNPARHYHLHTTPETAPYISPERWLEKNPRRHPGSWWPAWHRWLIERSAAQRVAPPPVGGGDYPPLGDAPGTYVHRQ